MRKIELFLLLVILLLGFFLRLYKFDGPVADWHSWRQADTSSVSRLFVQRGYDLLYPRYHDLSKTPSTIYNPEGYRFVEFPIYNVFQAGLFQMIGVFSIEQWGRLVSIFSSLFAGIFLFLLLRKYASSSAGIFGLLFYMILPFSIYYGRVILPDPMMVATLLGGMYFFSKMLEPGQKNTLLYFILSLVLTMSALLLKPFAGFFLLPFLAIAFAQKGLSAVKNYKIWIFFIASVIPLMLWRSWISNFPEGIPQSDFLFNSGGIRFKGAFFNWIFAERIGKLILGYWGVFIFVLGILTRKLSGSKEERGSFLFFLSFILSMLLFLIVVAGGNVQHDYYQISILPTIVMFMGLGAGFLWNPPQKLFSVFVSRSLLAVCTVLMLAFSWYLIRDFYNINNYDIVTAGRDVDRLTPKDAKIIAPYNGDTAYLYQTNRVGWPVFDRSMEEFLEVGADYMAILQPTQSDIEGLGRQFDVIASSSALLLIKLH